MKNIFRTFVSPLKRGTRIMFAVFCVFYFAELIGDYTKSFSVSGTLGLQSTAVWHGEVWRAITYAFLTPNLLLFVINGVLLFAMGAFLERVWSARELWFYCLICALGASLAKVLVMPSSSELIGGSFVLVFGLLVAWAKLYGRERVYFMGIWEMSVQSAALIFGFVNFLMVLPCGFINAVIMLCSGVTGWLYLILRVRSVLAQRSQTVGSVRMGHLEL